ncbi:hypothetical protein CONLIGDRAFT_649638 [Coniochaeta ligniaria NRRL 30616]|uniref:Alpha/beta hydrolase fold-3 domain-containing protein n=1 Tax=Coniochaeta ligniaria NRRL 30616 TaxID=1408157 RepID=A0A1J7J362_9PEZI|nr:hypothetical protein CONLIGDRAFT_649638 [Coniochaeta ligniaria NRRL 30616]
MATKTYPLKLKATPQYIPVDPNFKPLPKNGHLSKVDPSFAAIKDAADAAVAGLWEAKDWPTFRKLWDMPAQIPEWCPKEGQEVLTSTRLVPVRDGATVEIKVYKSRNVKKNAALVLKMHGGGWAIGGHETEQVENLVMAGHPEVVVVSVDYRMAPEHPFPMPVYDCFDVLKWAKQNASELGINPERIITAGGSAGGNLSAVVAMMARDKGVSGIIGQMLNFPVTCHPKHMKGLADKYELGSYVQNHDASVVNATRMELFWDAYDAEANPEPYHSPLLAKSLRGLPPALVQCAGLDPLRDEGIAYAEALKAAGVEVELYTYQGLPHCFSSMLLDIPQSRDYYKRVEAFLEKLVKSHRPNL